MTEDQYKQLCEACDTILLTDSSSIERISVPWLHVIREHPVFLKKYEDLFDDAGKVKKTPRTFLSRLRKVSRFRKYLNEKGSYYVTSITGKPIFDIIFVSHLLNNGQLGNEKDAYFSNLPSQLQQLGFKVAIVLINHSNIKAANAARSWQDSLVPRYILSTLLPFGSEINLEKQLGKESKILKTEALNLQYGFKRNVHLRAADEANSYETLLTYRMSKQFSKLFAELSVKVVIGTYEGHSWERILYKSARNANKDVTCIGYQHAAVFRFQHAIRRNLDAIYNPDIILCAGPVGQRQLQKASLLKNIPVVILGSDRGGTVKTEDINAADNHCCIVLPEGTLEECKILFEFSIGCANRNPKISFIWRLHPILNFDSLKIKFPAFKTLPPNIKISEQGFSDDIKMCNFALYRGSTAIIQAICEGIRNPIYLELPGELTIDPLYEIMDGKCIVSTFEEFENVVAKVIEVNPELEKEKEVLIDYCHKFYSKFDIKVLLSYL